MAAAVATSATDLKRIDKSAEEIVFGTNKNHKQSFVWGFRVFGRYLPFGFLAFGYGYGRSTTPSPVSQTFQKQNEFHDIFIYFCFYFFLSLQIFRSLESPAEDNRISDLRENVIIHREQFLKKVTFLSNAADLSNFNVSVSTELEKYEFVSGSAPLDLYACLPFGFIRYTHQPFNPDLSLSSPDLRECDALRILAI